MLFINNNGDVANFKLPHQIAIRPYVIAIQEVPPEEIDGDWGEWDPDTLTIKINDSAPPIMKYSAFIHEIIEAINGLYDLCIPHAKRTVIEIALQNVELIEEG